MVNRVTKDMKLDNDRNSQALDYAAGPELKDGLNIAGGISAHQIIQTDGFNLACESLYHVTLPELDKDGNYINVSLCCPFIPCKYAHLTHLSPSCHDQVAGFCLTPSSDTCITLVKI